MFTFDDGDQFLERLARRLEEAPDFVHERVAREIETSLAKVIDDQFAEALDPSGVPYLAPVDGGTPMRRSGALRASITVSAQSSQDGVDVRVDPGVPYGVYLQRGTARMAPRRIVPGLTTAGGAKWRAAASDAYRRAVAEWFGQG